MGELSIYTGELISNDEVFDINLREDGFIYRDDNDVYSYLFGKIDEFMSLANNWDGYNGIPISNEIGQAVKTFIASLPDTLIDRITDVFPNSHGTISIEWENGRNEKLSLEIGKNNNFSYFVNYLNRKPKLVDGNDKDVLSILGEIASDINSLHMEKNSK